MKEIRYKQARRMGKVCIVKDTNQQKDYFKK
jgi:hypothetical protein